jgi:MFS transporter, DHA3 family, macrolide efflux protein
MASRRPAAAAAHAVASDTNSKDKPLQPNEQHQQQQQPHNRSTFFALWLCQLASLIGSDIVSYALRVWTYKQTNSVSSFSLITFFVEAPALLLSPIAGVLVDRYPRKLLLLASDSMCAAATLTIALLHFNGVLVPWHIYIANTVASLAGALQWPAFKVGNIEILSLDL